MTAQDLKNSILQLAIQGKLVEQRVDEGTAKELLEQIKTEKERLIKEKKIKKDKPLPEITEEEIPFDIPESWEFIRLSSVADMYTGNSISETVKVTKYMNVSEGYSYIATKDVGFDNSIDYVNGVVIPFEEEKFRYAYNGSILMCIEGGSAGKKIGLLNQTVCFGNKLCTFNPILMDENFLFFYLQSPIFTSIFKEGITGIIGGVGINKLKELICPIPPLEEQKRIVAKIEELLSYVEQYDKAYSKLEVFNKKFPEDMQKSILQYAIQGKLVEQRPEEGTAEELYQQIQAEKAKLIKEGKIKKEKPLGEITDEEIPFEIPESWKWVRLQQVGELSRGKSKHRPRNDVRLFENGTFPLIQTGDVARADRLVKEYNTMYNDFGVKQSRIWRKGTVCLTIAANIGDVAILDFDACFPDSVVGFNAFEPIVSNKFFLYGLMCYKEILGKMSRSTAQKNINIDILSRVAFPLPPLKEQERIVLKIEELLPYSQQLKK